MNRGRINQSSGRECRNLRLLPLATSRCVANHTCAITTIGRPYCWGLNYLGQLGRGTNPLQSNTRLRVETNGWTAEALFSGNQGSCALVSALVYCWGGNMFGQLGDGTYTTRYFPVKVM